MTTEKSTNATRDQYHESTTIARRDQACRRDDAHDFNYQVVAPILDNDIANVARAPLRFIEFSFEEFSCITNITI